MRCHVAAVKIVAMNDIFDISSFTDKGLTYNVGYIEDTDAIVILVYYDGNNYDLYNVQLDSM